MQFFSCKHTHTHGPTQTQTEALAYTFICVPHIRSTLHVYIWAREIPRAVWQTCRKYWEIHKTIIICLCECVPVSLSVCKCIFWFSALWLMHSALTGACGGAGESAATHELGPHCIWLPLNDSNGYIYMSFDLVIKSIWCVSVCGCVIFVCPNK